MPMRHQLSNGEIETKKYQKVQKIICKIINFSLQVFYYFLLYFKRKKKSIELNSKSIDFENIHMPAKQCA